MTKLWIAIGVAVTLLCVSLQVAQGQNEGDSQYEPAGEGEREFSESFEKSQTASEVKSTAELEKAGIPRNIENAENLQRESRSSKDSTGRSLSVSASQIRSLNPYTYQYTLANNRDCCPRRQKYGCGSIWGQIPCYYDRINNRICCPFGRQVRQCNCKDCTVLEEDCAVPGKCLRRYTRRTLWGICINLSTYQWTWVRDLVRWVPTSCYCRKGKCTRFVFSPYITSATLSQRALPVA